jgi:siroheme synthase
MQQTPFPLLLAEKAREGRIVVRLQVGRSFVFDSGEGSHLPARAAHSPSRSCPA